MKNKSIYEQALKEVQQETVGLDWSSCSQTEMGAGQCRPVSHIQGKQQEMEQ